MPIEYNVIGSDSDLSTRHVVTEVNGLPVACTCKSFYFGIQRALDKGTGEVFTCKYMNKVYARIVRHNPERQSANA